MSAHHSMHNLQCKSWNLFAPFDWLCIHYMWMGEIASYWHLTFLKLRGSPTQGQPKSCSTDDMNGLRAITLVDMERKQGFRWGFHCILHNLVNGPHRSNGCFGLSSIASFHFIWSLFFHFFVFHLYFNFLLIHGRWPPTSFFIKKIVNNSIWVFRVSIWSTWGVTENVVESKRPC